jgi:hypothetical protein
VHNGPFSFVADFLSMAMENPKFEIRKSVDLTSDFGFRISDLPGRFHHRHDLSSQAVDVFLLGSGDGFAQFENE